MEILLDVAQISLDDYTPSTCEEGGREGGRGEGGRERNRTMENLLNHLTFLSCIKTLITLI